MNNKRAENGQLIAKTYRYVWIWLSSPEFLYGRVASFVELINHGEVYIFLQLGCNEVHAEIPKYIEIIKKRNEKYQVCLRMLSVKEDLYLKRE